MDILKISVFTSIIGIISILFVYLYLYILYRERFIGVWLLTYLLLLSRYAIFDSGFFNWKQSLFGMSIYQGMLLFSILLFIWAIHLFIRKPIAKKWFYITLFFLLIVVLSNMFFSALAYTFIFSIFYGSCICFWAGVLFIKQLRGIGGILAGYSYIIWGILNLTMPFTINTWFAPWGYSLGGFLRLIIAIATLMIYFEKTRTDLTNKEAQYRLLAENAVDIIYYFTFIPKLTLKYINPAVYSITGYPPSNFYNKPRQLLRIFHPEDRKALRIFIRSPFTVTEPLTLRLIRSNGEIVWLEQKCIPLYDEHNNLLGFEGIVRDITDRKNFELMAATLDRVTVTGNMAATVAHEIRNPMTIVSGYLQLLQSRQEYCKERTTFLLMIDELNRADAIIQEYLSLSRQKAVVLEQCSLSNIIEAMFPLLEANAKAVNIILSLELSKIPLLLLDKNDIRQLLLNLVRNAIEAMPNGGRLTIKTYCQDNHVVLVVADEGSGIPQNILDRLGNPFVTSKQNGTGLGIPICYQIIRRHNADVKIDTNSFGTKFYIYFNK